MKTYDLYAIGNALVDSEYEVTELELQNMGVDKRHMTLISAQRQTELLTHLGCASSRQTGGGSAGNTAVALSQLGGRAFYSCRVANDALGLFYTQDLAANGIATNLSDTCAPPGHTGSCLVMVTPDAERSMSTFLGATADLDHTALNEQAVADSHIYYMEGYLAASPNGLHAALRGRQIAKDAGVALATTLSDTSMIKYCRSGLESLIGSGVDYLFCNEEEAQVWCDTTDIERICKQLGPMAQTVCLTRGPLGCLILEGGQQITAPALSIKALDTNGAGDMFAGAFLYAKTQGHTHAQSAWLANQAAGQVVGQYGNRLTTLEMSRLKTSFKTYLQD